MFDLPVYVVALGTYAAFAYYPRYVWRQACKKHREGDYPGAVSEFSKVVSWWWLGQAWTARALAARASSRTIIGENAQALEDCNRSLELQQVNSVGLAVRGLCKWNTFADSHDALADIDASLAINPKAVLGLGCKGIVLRLSGDNENAIVWLTKAIEVEPTSTDYYLHRSGAYSQMWFLDKALEDCDRVIKLAPKYAQGWAHRSSILALLDRMAEAYEDCNNALELSPDSPHTIGAMAYLLLLDHKYQDALMFLDQVQRLPHDPYSFHSSRTVFLMALRRYADAVAECDLAMQLKPTSYLAVNRAYANLCMGYLDVCAADLDLAESLNPHNPNAVSNRARWLLACNEGEHARNHIEKFAAASPSAARFPDFLTTQGIVYKSLLKYDESLKLFESALELYPAHLQSLWHKGDALEKLGKVDEGSAAKERAILKGYVIRP